MSQSLKTKNVFLTGGAQGLGKMYADALLAAGARVSQSVVENSLRLLEID